MLGHLDRWDSGWDSCPSWAFLDIRVAPFGLDCLLQAPDHRFGQTRFFGNIPDWKTVIQQSCYSGMVYVFDCTCCPHLRIAEHFEFGLERLRIFTVDPTTLFQVDLEAGTLDRDIIRRSAQGD